MNRCIDMDLKFQLSLKNKELEDIKQSSRHAIETNQALRSEILTHEENVRAHSTVVCGREEEIRALKSLLQSRTEALLRRNENRLGSCGNILSNPNEGTNADMDIINLVDISDPEILEDIEYARSEQRGLNNDVEVIDLEPSEPSQTHNSHMEKIQELESQLELKNAMLSSALIQIETLEKELKHNILLNLKLYKRNSSGYLRNDFFKFKNVNNLFLKYWRSLLCDF